MADRLALPYDGSEAGGEENEPRGGAFERFITSAIATILTIVFSWRILLDHGGDDALGGRRLEYRPQMEKNSRSSPPPVGVAAARGGGGEGNGRGTGVSGHSSRSGDVAGTWTGVRHSANDDDDRRQTVAGSARAVKNNVKKPTASDPIDNRRTSSHSPPEEYTWGGASTNTTGASVSSSRSSSSSRGEGSEARAPLGVSTGADLNTPPPTTAEGTGGQRPTDEFSFRLTDGDGSSNPQQLHFNNSTYHASHEHFTVFGHTSQDNCVDIGIVPVRTHYLHTGAQGASNTIEWPHDAGDGSASPDDYYSANQPGGVTALTADRLDPESTGALDTGNVRCVVNTTQGPPHPHIDYGREAAEAYGSYPDQNTADNAATDMDNKDLQRTIDSVREQYNRILRDNGSGDNNKKSAYSKSTTNGEKKIDPRYINSSDSDDSSNDDDDGGNDSATTLEKKTTSGDDSGSDESLGRYYYTSGGGRASGEREYTLGEQLGEDSSDSEYCVVFKRVLEVITEEETDDGHVGDTDAEVHDIPADDESASSASEDGERKVAVAAGVAIGNGGLCSSSRQQQQLQQDTTSRHCELPSATTNTLPQPQQQLSSLDNPQLQPPPHTYSSGPTSRVDHGNDDSIVPATSTTIQAAGAISTEGIEKANCNKKRGNYGGILATPILPATADDNELSSLSSSDELICVTAAAISTALQRDGRNSSIDFLGPQGLSGIAAGNSTNSLQSAAVSQSAGAVTADSGHRVNRQHLGRSDSEEQSDSSAAPNSSVSIKPLPPHAYYDHPTTTGNGSAAAGSGSGREAGIGDGEWSESDLTDTNSIDVTVDDLYVEPDKLAEAQRARQYGGVIGTQRPVTIGPYHDRLSQFSRLHYIQGVSTTTGGTDTSIATVRSGDPASVNIDDPVVRRTTSTSGNHDDHSTPGVTELLLSTHVPTADKHHLPIDKTDNGAAGGEQTSVGGPVGRKAEAFWIPYKLGSSTDVVAGLPSRSIGLNNSSSGSNRCNINVIPAAHLNSHKANTVTPGQSSESSDTTEQYLGIHKEIRDNSTPITPAFNEDYLHSQYYTIHYSSSSASNKHSATPSEIPTAGSASPRSTSTQEFDTAEDLSTSSNSTYKYRTAETLSLVGSAGENGDFKSKEITEQISSAGSLSSKEKVVAEWGEPLRSSDNDVIITDVRMVECINDGGIAHQENNSSLFNDAHNRVPTSVKQRPLTFDTLFDFTKGPTSTGGNINEQSLLSTKTLTETTTTAKSCHQHPTYHSQHEQFSRPSHIESPSPQQQPIAATSSVNDYVAGGSVVTKSYRLSEPTRELRPTSKTTPSAPWPLPSFHGNGSATTEEDNIDRRPTEERISSSGVAAVARAESNQYGSGAATTDNSPSSSDVDHQYQHASNGGLLPSSSVNQDQLKGAFKDKDDFVCGGSKIDGKPAGQEAFTFVKTKSLVTDYMFSSQPQSTVYDGSLKECDENGILTTETVSPTDLQKQAPRSSSQYYFNSSHTVPGSNSVNTTTAGEQPTPDGGPIRPPGTESEHCGSYGIMLPSTGPDRSAINRPGEQRKNYQGNDIDPNLLCASRSGSLPSDADLDNISPHEYAMDQSGLDPSGKQRPIAKSPTQQQQTQADYISGEATAYGNGEEDHYRRYGIGPTTRPPQGVYDEHRQLNQAEDNIITPRQRWTGSGPTSSAAMNINSIQTAPTATSGGGYWQPIKEETNTNRAMQLPLHCPKESDLDGQEQAPKSPRSCTAMATSTALARKDTGSSYSSNSDLAVHHAGGSETPRSVISAIGNAEATGENPYIAVARATARAATIASANAAAGVAKMPGGAEDGSPESPSDINVVISTSCTIKDENLHRLQADSSDVIHTMHSQPGTRYQQEIIDTTNADGTNAMGMLPHSQQQRLQDSYRQQQRPLSRDDSFDGPKKMVITIEQEGSRGVKERKSRTVECELPQMPSDADMTRMISSAVKRILKSSSSSLEPRSSSSASSSSIRDEDMNDVIERVTQQVVEAYSTDRDRNSPVSSTEQHQPPRPRTSMSSAKYPYKETFTSPPARPPAGRIVGESVPSFRGPGRIDKGTYREMHRIPKKDDEDDSLSKYAVPVNSFGQRFQYVSGNKPPRPKLGTRALEGNRNDDREPTSYIYVTGTGPKSSPASGVTEEVTLTVAANNISGPTVEHIILSETESGSEAGTPVPMRRGLDKDPHYPLQQHQPSQKQQQGIRTTLPDPQKKIKGILRSPVKSDPGLENDYRSSSPLTSEYGFKSTTTTAKPPLPTTRKPYESVLLRPVQDKKTSLRVTQQYESPEKQPSEQKSRLDDARKGYLSLVPKSPPWPTNTVLDAVFEEKKRRWYEKPSRTPSPGLMMVDIDIDQTSGGSHMRRAQSREELKQRLNAARPKAPNTADIDRRWKSVASLKPYKSQGNLLDRKAMETSYHGRTRTDSTGSNVSATTAEDLRRVRSLGTLPSQFFQERRSYTSLMETDLDTGISTETPLVYETDLDQVLPSKARSLTNLAKTQTMVPVELDDDRHRSMDTLHSDRSSLIYSLPRDESDNSSNTSSFDPTKERSLSAGELRISQSLSKLSIPEWYRSSFGKSKKAIELPHTKNRREPGSSELLDSSFDSTHGSLDRKPPTPPRPVVIQHRVSSTMRMPRSPCSSGPSTPVDTSKQFELPSAKLKQTHVELKPVETKPIERFMPPASQSAHQQPKKESAKEAYLRIKAKSDAQQNISISTTNTSSPFNDSLRSGEKANHSMPEEKVLTVESIPAESAEWYNATIHASPSPGVQQSIDAVGDSAAKTGNDSGNNYSLAHNTDTATVIRADIEPKPEAETFPVLSYADSPPLRRKFADEIGHSEQIKSVPSNNEDATTLDQIMGGLLGIPSGSKSTQSIQSDLAECNEDNRSLKSKVFGMLKQAKTPRGSMISLNKVGNDSDPEEFNNTTTNLMSSSISSTHSYDEEKVSEDLAIVKCSSPKCKKAAVLTEARKYYKTCHNCYTYYCSRECRKSHWGKHKQKCLFSRVNSMCKHIVRKIHDTPSILDDMSDIARTGYESKGSGCVLLAFSSPEKAEEYLSKGVSEANFPPGYIGLTELQEERTTLGEHQHELLEMISSYNPDLKFVLEIIIVAGEELPTRPAPKREGPAIKKCSRLRLSTSTKPILTPTGTPASIQQPKPSETETLILTALPGAEFTENMSEKKAREISFGNIQRQLRQRGVTLRHHFPDVHKTLSAFVSDNTAFAPMTIYPMDINTGKRFMCLIMPNSEPEVEWSQNPDLLDELGLATQV